MRPPKRIWYWLALVGAGAYVGVSYLVLHPHAFEPVESRAARLSKSYGIVIGYEDPSKFCVPPFHPAAADGAQVPRAATSSVRTALDGIEAGLDVYPRGFVSNLVKAIFIAGDIRINGQPSGGFTAATWFVLAAAEDSGDEGVRLTSLYGVHHELSSFVLKKANAVDAWRAFSPADWKFDSTLDDALIRGKGKEPPLSTGFLSAYGASTAENDFNTYAEKVFLEPEALVALACKHELIRKKLQFVLDTYVGLDPRMDEVFRKLGINRAKLCSN